MIKYGLKTGM